MSFSSYLSTFWGNDLDRDNDEFNVNTRRNKNSTTIKTKTIEVIGGSNGNELPPLPPLGSSQSKPWRTNAGLSFTPNQSTPSTSTSSSTSTSTSTSTFSTSPSTPLTKDPRLPTEITNTIILIAASRILQDQSQSKRKDEPPINRVLDLSRINRSTHRTIFCFLILPKITLYGLNQIKAFSKSLEKDGANVGLKEMVSNCVSQLNIITTSFSKNNDFLNKENNRGYNGKRFEEKEEKQQLGRKVLDVSNGNKASTLNSTSSSSSSPSLYDSILSLSKFENSTLNHLKFILSHCDSIKKISLGCTPLILDPRWKGEFTTASSNDFDDMKETYDSIQIIEGLDSVRKNLEEMICLQTLYGGDLNEELWNLSSSSLSSIGKKINNHNNNWKNLKRLQLHGPRFRLTIQLVKKLGNLPSLEEIGLIMPLIQKRETSSTFSSSSSSRDIEYNKEVSFFQILIEYCFKLKRLLLIGHDMKQFVGNSKIYSLELHSLKREWKTKCTCLKNENEKRERDEIKNDSQDGRRGERRRSRNEFEIDENQESDEKPLRIQLVTAKIKQDESNEFKHYHPTIFSDWMLERTRNGNEWNWESEEKENKETINYENIVYSLESWDCPFETPFPPDIDPDPDLDSHSNLEEDFDVKDFSEEGIHSYNYGSGSKLENISNLCKNCQREEKIRIRKDREENKKRLEREERDRVWKEHLRIAGINRRKGEKEDEVMGIDNLAY